jgi:arylsulfatase A-like enzyme
MKNGETLLFGLLAIFVFISCGKSKQVYSQRLEGVNIQRTEEKLPNIVFILSDDQSWTDYGFMDHPHIETPNLDKLSRESLTFAQAYVPTSLCSPSLASIITGLYPRHHLVLGNDRVLPTDVLPKDKSAKRAITAKNYRPVIENFKSLNTLPDLLKEKDYISFQTGKWWLGNHANGGFDYGMTHGDVKRGGRHGDNGLKIGRQGMDTLYSYIDMALDKEKPFFMWYAPYLPHRPHNPPDSLVQKYLPKAPTEYVAKYWAMCEWFDITCGQLMDYIESKKQTNNTIFVYVCDNGWVQNENKPGYNKNSKRAPYDYGMRSPIMFKWQGEITPKLDNRYLVSSVDIVPTVLNLLGIEQPEGLDGINVLDEAKLQNRNTIFGEIYAHDFYTVDSSLYYRMAFTDPYKIIIPNEKNKPNEDIQLFDIYKDPFEQVDLAARLPEIVEELENRIDESWSK